MKRSLGPHQEAKVSIWRVLTALGCVNSISVYSQISISSLPWWTQNLSQSIGGIKGFIDNWYSRFHSSHQNTWKKILKVGRIGSLGLTSGILSSKRKKKKIKLERINFGSQFRDINKSIIVGRTGHNWVVPIMTTKKQIKRKTQEGTMSCDLLSPRDTSTGTPRHTALQISRCLSTQFSR